MFHCEKCGREAGLQIVACPDRQSGACAYRVIADPRPGFWARVFLILLSLPALGGGIAVAVIAAVMAGRCLATPEAAWGEAFPRPFVVPIAVFIFLVGLCTAWFAARFWLAAFGERLRLTNAETGQVWCRRTVGAMEVDRHVIADLQPVELVGDDHVLLRYPASIATLAGGRCWLPSSRRWIPSLAVHVFAAALLNLVHQRQLLLFTAASYRSRCGLPLTRDQDECIVACGQSVDNERVDGALERRIVKTVLGWATRPEAKEYPKGPTVYELVRGIYDDSQDDPWVFFLDIAASDAVARGLAVAKGWLECDAGRSCDPTWDSHFADGLQADHKLVRGLFDRLQEARPDILELLVEMIERGIKSRQDNSP